MDLVLWDEFRSLERRMDDVFRTFLGPRARAWFPAVGTAWHGPFAPAIDVFERKGSLVVRAELPGIDPATDVKVRVEAGDLVVSGERTQKEEIKEEHYYRMEATYGSFERRVPLPDGVDERKIRADYKDGVLEIVVPLPAKALEKPKTKTIPIKTAA